MSIQKPVQPIQVVMGRAERGALDAFLQTFVIISQIYDLDSFTTAACIGQALGDMMACADCTIEKGEKIAEDDPSREPLKQTLLLNFNSQYNIHRSKHEQNENACSPKPEPKIV